MRKKDKLKYYKGVRQKRDELLKCDNLGRKRRLLLEMPNVQRVDTFRTRTDAILFNGYSFSYWGLDSEEKCCIDVYFYWLKEVLTTKS